MSPLSNGVPLWACAASGRISIVNETAPERKDRGTGLITRARRTIGAFCTSADQFVSYGAKLRGESEQRPMNSREYVMQSEE